MTTNVMNKGWFNPVSFFVLLILISVSVVLYILQIANILVLALLILFSGLFASAIRIADQWERAVVLRMGKYKGLKGPGPFVIIPIIDSVSVYIDQRVRVSSFKAEQTLTKDVVPLMILLLTFTGCLRKPSLEWIPFNWEGDTISGKYIEKAYIYIPVKIEELPYDFTMQLDLGTYKSLFYENTIAPYLEESTSLGNKLDSTKTWVRNINLLMGTAEFNGIDLGYYKNLGEKVPKDSLYS